MNKNVEEVLMKTTDRIIRYKLDANDIMDLATQLNRLALHKAISERLEVGSSSKEQEEESSVEPS